MMGGSRPPDADPAWAYFLDFDGTLVSIASSPDRVRVDRGLRGLIDRLHRFAGGAVALITGRSITDVDALLPGTRVAVAGQHGLEHRTASGRHLRHTAPLPGLDRVRDRLAETVSRHPRLLLEDKGSSLALHYRRAPSLASYAHRLARAQAALLGDAYGIRAGKRVVEIAPVGKDKGMAIEAFMAEAPFRGRTPVFLGDDVTDELGFRMINQLGGLSIKVGPGRTDARWRLRDVASVRAWLPAKRGGR